MFKSAHAMDGHAAQCPLHFGRHVDSVDTEEGAEEEDGGVEEEEEEEEAGGLEEACQAAKGGYVAPSIHSFAAHMAPRVQGRFTAWPIHIALSLRPASSRS